MSDDAAKPNILATIAAEVEQFPQQTTVSLQKEDVRHLLITVENLEREVTELRAAFRRLDSLASSLFPEKADV